MHFMFRFSRLNTPQKMNLGSNFFKRHKKPFSRVMFCVFDTLMKLKYLNLNFDIPLFSSINGYPVLEKIGEGRCAVCYLSETKDKIPVIMKCLKKHWFFIKKTPVTEFDVLSKISNPFIPKIIDTFSWNHVKIFILEYKNGKNLAEIIYKDEKCFSYKELLELFDKILTIVACLHKNRIIHRDIKPSNIIYNNGDVFLIDFGFSRFVKCGGNDYILDFLYLGNLLLFLLYSNYEGEMNGIWSEQLILTKGQKEFINRLLWIVPTYYSISEIQTDFRALFLPSEKC